MSIKFNGLMSEVATFTADSPIAAGTPVAMADNGKVASAANGAAFIGTAVNHSKGLQGVQLHGYAEFTYSSSAPALGYARLSADGSGGVKTDDTNGRECLVVSVDTSAKKVGVILGI